MSDEPAKQEKREVFALAIACALIVAGKVPLCDITGSSSPNAVDQADSLLKRLNDGDSQEDAA